MTFAQNSARSNEVPGPEGEQAEHVLRWTQVEHTRVSGLVISMQRYVKLKSHFIRIYSMFIFWMSVCLSISLSLSLSHPHTHVHTSLSLSFLKHYNICVFC